MLCLLCSPGKEPHHTGWFDPFADRFPDQSNTGNGRGKFHRFPSLHHCCCPMRGTCRLIEVVGPSLLGILSDFTRVPAKFPGVTQEDRDMNFQLWLKEKKEMSKLAKAEQDSGALGWAQKEEEELRDTQGLTPKVKNIIGLVGVFVEGWCLFVPGTCIDVVYNFDPDRNGEAILLCRKKFKIW